MREVHTVISLVVENFSVSLFVQQSKSFSTPYSCPTMSSQCLLRLFLISTTTSISIALTVPPNYRDFTSPDATTTDCWLEEPPATNQSSFLGGNRPLLKCNWTNRIESAYETNSDLYMDWNVTASCPSRRSKTPEDFPTALSMREQAFELWNEDECTCRVNEVVKYRLNAVGQIEEVRISSDACSCTMCPYGYGRNHVILDCSRATNNDDPSTVQVQTGNLEPILDNCTSFDCNHACNGDCGLTCSNAGPECCLCREDCPEPTKSPTLAPIASGAGNGETSGISSPAKPLSP